MTVDIFNDDCLNVMRKMKDDEIKVECIITDPPYELSNDGKASPYRIATEMLFPQQPYINTAFGHECHLSFLISEIAHLMRHGSVPRPASAVPEVAMTLNENTSSRQVEINDMNEGSVGTALSNASLDGKPELTKHLGYFAFKLGNTSAAHEAFDRIGCSFEAGGLGIGFRVGAAGFPSLMRGCFPIVFSDPDVGTLNYTGTGGVLTDSAAENQTVARLTLGGSTNEVLTASAALTLFSVASIANAKLVRASTGASRLPAMLQPIRFRVVAPATNRAVTFDLLVHEQRLAGSGFMNKAWDGGKIAFDRSVWKAAYDLLPPGGYLLAFGGTRTFHRLACIIEDVGFEYRDTLMWLYGSGFPKSYNLKNEWEGFGTALKPAWEPIIMARKPLNGTVAENVLEYGTGALNIDACRVEGRDRTEYGLSNSTRSQVNTYGKPTESADFDSNKGRWPANVVHDGSEEIESVFAAFGDRKSCNSPSKARPEGSILGGRRSQGAIYPGEDGSVSRFFYSAKASKEDRADSKHPTVKPINLMRWLIRMVTPPGGTVLDPFAGSGTTLAAAVMEGFNAIGIEKEEEYYNDIVNRMNNVKYDGEVKTEKRNSNKNQTELNFDHLTLDEKNELLEKMIRGEV